MLLPCWFLHFFPIFFSHKFGKKVTYLNYLSDLREHLKYDQLNIPQEVVRYVASFKYFVSRLLRYSCVMFTVFQAESDPISSVIESLIYLDWFYSKICIAV